MNKEEKNMYIEMVSKKFRLAKNHESSLNYSDALKLMSECLKILSRLKTLENEKRRYDKMIDEFEKYHEKLLSAYNYSKSIISIKSNESIYSNEYRKINNDSNEIEVLNCIIKPSKNLSFSSISGFNSIKQKLYEQIILPYQRPDLIKNGDISNNLLIYGPPLNGKTLLIKALASECDRDLINISPSLIVGKNIYESEKFIKLLFQIAMGLNHSIIFLDDGEAIFGKGGEYETKNNIKMKNCLLHELNSVSNHPNCPLFIIASDCPWELDDAIFRRLQLKIYVPLPQIDTVMHLMKTRIDTMGYRYMLSSIDVNRLFNELEGFSGGDVYRLIEEAARVAIRRSGKPKNSQNWKPSEIEPLRLIDFKEAVSVIRPSASQEMLKEYDNFSRVISI